MQRTFREYVAAGNSILLSTHLLDMAEGLCNRVLILSNGILLDDQLIDDSWLQQHGTLQDYFFKLTREN
jgi:ABC-2 type transport system ATP-binding protein